MLVINVCTSWVFNTFMVLLCANMIEELISRGQQLGAVHFTYEVGLVDKFPPVPLLKAFLKDARKAAASILDDPNNPGRAVVFILLLLAESLILFILVV